MELSTKQIKPFLACLAFALLFSFNAFAANSLAQVMCDIIFILQGRIGRVIAAGAIFVLGILFFLGKMDWKILVTLVVGIALLFGAKTVALAILPSKVAVGSGTSTGEDTPERIINEECPDLF